MNLFKICEIERTFNLNKFNQVKDKIQIEYNNLKKGQANHD